MGIVISGVKRLLATFRRRDEGNVAIIFALVMIPVIGIAATAIDYGRASKTRSILERAADAAAIEAASDLFRDETLIRDEIRHNLDSNLPAELKGIPFKMHIPSDRGSVEVTMETSIKTSLAAILGVMKLDIAIGAKANRVENPGHGKISPEVAVEMEKQLRYLYEQMQHAGGMAGASGGFPSGYGGGAATR